MIASFPIGTDPEAALDAGKEFAEMAFGSGDYGDTWDYMLALNTDKPHPYVSLIINRDGLDEGRQLQTYKMNALSPAKLRTLQVMAAARCGIELTTAPQRAGDI